MTSSLILAWAFVFIALPVYSEFTRPTSDSLRNWRILRDMILSKDFLWRAAFCISLGWILVACGNDRREYFYQTLADADKAGEITRGWIPHDLIPNSSRAIHLVEELSPSKEWCAFEFSLADAEILRKNLKSIDTLPPSVRRVQTPVVSWWPEVLKGKLNLEKIRTVSPAHPTQFLECGFFRT